MSARTPATEPQPARGTRRLVPARRELPALVWMALVYLGLLGTFSAASVVSAAAVVLLVRAVVPLPRLPRGGRVHVGGLLRLAGYLAVDLVRSSAQVTWYALRPRRLGGTPTTSVLAVPLRTRSDVMVVTTSQLISLVPGSILVDLDMPSATLYLHVLGVDRDGSSVGLHRRVQHLERLVAGALGSAAELARCGAGGTAGGARPAPAGTRGGGRS